MEHDRKILILDIETKPITALVWGLFNQNIGLNQIVDPGGILCIGAKWLGEKKTHLYSVWEHGYEGMLLAIHDMMSEAVAVITYNGNRFDLPKLRGAFVEAGLPPPPPISSIDIYATVKKLGLVSGKLAFVGPYFKIGKKVETGGMELWTGVMAGDPSSEKKMAKYCIQDVVLLELVYIHLLPFVVNHPNLGGGAGSCSHCGSKKTTKRGFRYTKLLRIQRIQCNDCNGWGDGQRSKI